MRRSDLGVVGTSGDAEVLLDTLGQAARDLAEAHEQGQLVRQKIRGQWIYASSEAAIQSAIEAVEAEAMERVHEWLIGAATYLRHPVANSITRPRVTFRSVEVLVRELVHLNKFEALGLLTNTYEPYLALYVPSDTAEVETQIDAMSSRLVTHGYVTAHDLPRPRLKREGEAWRGLVLRHGEFLGLGRLDPGDRGALVAWDSP